MLFISRFTFSLWFLQSFLLMSSSGSSALNDVAQDWGENYWDQKFYYSPRQSQSYLEYRIEIFTSLLFRVRVISNPFLVCFWSLFFDRFCKLFAHAVGLSHENMEISTALLWIFVLFVAPIKRSSCLSSHACCLCHQHLTFVRTVDCCVDMIWIAVRSVALNKAAATLLRGFTCFRRLRVRVWWTGIGIGALRARPSACCPFVPAFFAVLLMVSPSICLRTLNLSQNSTDSVGWW